MEQEFQTLTASRSNINMSFTVLPTYALAERYVLFGGTKEILNKPYTKKSLRPLGFKVTFHFNEIYSFSLG